MVGVLVKRNRDLKTQRRQTWRRSHGQRQRLELCCYKPRTPVIGTNHWKLEEAKKDAS